MIEDIISSVNDYLYSYILIILLIAAGLFFSFKTRFVQFRSLKNQFKLVGEKPEEKGAVSSFQALMVSTASRVGTGNIIGVSTALCLGGYGSVFWMWLIAIIGSASAFIESTLAQIFKKNENGEAVGGPAYYIEAGLKNKGLAIIFSVLLIITYGIGFNMLASYNLQSTFSCYEFYNPKITPVIIGIITAAMVGYCLIGGGKRIVKVTSLLVPIMGVIYFLVSLIIIFMNITELPKIFVRIFSEAFNLKAIFGGFGGSCVMYGIKRGLFSNEAGVGSAPNASASANVSHPVKQGLVQILSVFIDTIVVCSATAFMCMCSGVEPTKELSGALYIQTALSSVLGKFGPIFITAAMILFAFTTLLGNLYYVDRCVIYILGHKPSKKLDTIIKLIASIIILLGAILSADLLWNISDIAMGGMTMINIPVIIILSKYSFKALKDYEYQLKLGSEPIFKRNTIDLEYKTDYWR